MRTTLELDDRVLAAARAKADAEGISLGRAVSDLALKAIDVVYAPTDFPVFAAVPGHVISDELVAQHRDD